jgi:hypothetical protein
MQYKLCKVNNTKLVYFNLFHKYAATVNMQLIFLIKYCMCKELYYVRVFTSLCTEFWLVMFVCM